MIDNVVVVVRGGKVYVVSVTDNFGGNLVLFMEMLCAEIKKIGMELLVYLVCRDKNRNEIESMFYGLVVEGVCNVLFLIGDYFLVDGFEGMLKLVFDLDFVNVLCLVG